MAVVKNLIFDLGNVLYDIDFKIMYQEFENLGITNIGALFTLNESHTLFLDLEKGRVSENDFYSQFRDLVKINLTDDQIKNAWNSLLIGFRNKSIDWVSSNNSSHPTFLYSNTNQIHYNHFIPQFEKEVASYAFENLFIKPYYSHEMGMRKPDPASFVFILEKEGLLAHQTLFIDDNEPNILAAAAVGLQVLHLKEGMRVEDIIL